MMTKTIKNKKENCRSSLITGYPTVFLLHFLLQLLNRLFSAAPLFYLPKESEDEWIDNMLGKWKKFGKEMKMTQAFLNKIV